MRLWMVDSWQMLNSFTVPGYKLFRFPNKRNISRDLRIMTWICVLWLGTFTSVQHRWNSQLNAAWAHTQTETYRHTDTETQRRTLAHQSLLQSIFMACTSQRPCSTNIVCCFILYYLCSNEPYVQHILWHQDEQKIKFVGFVVFVLWDLVIRIDRIVWLQSSCSLENTN